MLSQFPIWDGILGLVVIDQEQSQLWLDHYLAFLKLLALFLSLDRQLQLSHQDHPAVELHQYSSHWLLPPPQSQYELNQSGGSPVLPAPASGPVGSRSASGLSGSPTGPGLSLVSLIANLGADKHLVLELQVPCAEVEDWGHNVAVPGDSKAQLPNSFQPLEVKDGDRLQGRAEGPA